MSTKKNYIYKILSSAISAVCTVITTPYLSRVLSPSGIGVFSLSFSLATSFVVFSSLGINLYGVREIAFVRHNPKSRTKTFWEIFLLHLSLVLFFLLFYFLSSLIFPDQSHAIIIFSTYLLSSIFDISWFFQGLEKFRPTSFSSSLSTILLSISVFLFIKSPSDLYLYIILFSLAFLFSHIFTWPSLKQNLTKISLKSLKPFSHLRPTFIIFTHQFFNRLYVDFSKPLITLLCNNPAEVGFYSQSEYIIRNSTIIITTLAAVATPKISNYIATSQTKKLRSLMKKSLRFDFFLGLPMIFGLILVSDWFTTFFFGPGYETISLLLIILSPLILILSLATTIGIQYFIPKKHHRELTISYLIGAILNFLLNLLLVPSLHSLGASISLLVTESAVTISQLIFIRKKLPLRSLLSLATPFILPTAVMFISGLILKSLLAPSVLSLLLLIFSSVATYLLTLFLQNHFTKKP